MGDGDSFFPPFLFPFRSKEEINFLHNIEYSVYALQYNYIVCRLIVGKGIVKDSIEFERRRNSGLTNQYSINTRAFVIEKERGIKMNLYGGA